jgi:hypothetical protein
MRATRSWLWWGIGGSILLGGCAALLDLRDDYTLGAGDGGTPVEEGGTPPSCTNGKVDESESDIDCGGACPKCADGKTCQIAADCASGVCGGQPKTCQAPRCDDGVKNAGETDVDCAGACPRCALGATCEAGTDCIASAPDAGDAGPLTECVKSQCTPMTPVATWLNRNPAANYTTRTSGTVTYDPVRKRTLLFGGFSGAALNDLWSWDGTGWTPGTPGTARQAHGAAWDDARGQLVVANGFGTSNTTATWNGTVWADGGAGFAAQRYMFPMANDPVRQRVLAYGGAAQGLGAFAGLSAWDGIAWSTVNEGGGTKPSLLAGASLAFDTARGVLVLFGGMDDVPGTPKNETWIWNGMSWTLATPGRAPPPRSNGCMAYDTVRQRMVLVGGFGAGTQLDTWEWNGTTWTPSIPFPEATPSEGDALAYDIERKRMVLANMDVGRTYEYSVVGNACVTGADCASGFCVDRVCCSTGSCGACQSCNQLATPGTCTTVRDAPDPDSCAAPMRCNAAGMCQ